MGLYFSDIGLNECNVGCLARPRQVNSTFYRDVSHFEFFVSSYRINLIRSFFCDDTWQL